MKRLNKIFILIGLLCLVNCAASTRISEIRQEPRRFHDNVVSISGVVENTITLPVLNLGLYQIDDGSGKIWVKPKSKIPFKGDHVSVKGKIKVGMTISGQSFGLVLIESTDDQYY